MLSRLSLRARLLLGVIAIASVGLVTADVATYAALKSFLIDRVDTALNSVHQGVEGVFFPQGRGGPGGGRTAEHPGRVQPDPRLLHRAEDAQRGGGRRRSSASRSSDSRSPRRARSCPRRSSFRRAPNTPRGRPRHFFTVPAVSGGGSYRVRASTEARDPTHVLLIAAPLNDVNSTLHRLLLIELGVTVAVLCTMILLGLWIVRLGLRPLEKIGQDRRRDRRRRPLAPRRAAPRSAPRSAGSGSRSTRCSSTSRRR